MEPYVAHWLEGWENERRCQGMEGLCKVDYVYFLPRSPLRSNKATEEFKWNEIGIDVCSHPEMGQIHRMDFEKAMTGFASPMSKVLGCISQAVEAGLCKLHAEFTSHGQPDTNETNKLQSNVSDAPSVPLREIVQNVSAYSMPRIARKTIRITAEITLPSRPSKGLAELFQEPDLRHFILHRA